MQNTAAGLFTSLTGTSWQRTLRRVIMFKNYLHTAFRYLFRNKAIAVLNILGLSIGIACFILIFLYVDYHFNYDKHTKNYKNIYKLKWRFKWTMKSLFRYAIDKFCLCRAVKIALVVGTINALVTQYDAIFHKTLTPTNIFQIMLTYMIPYGVATISSALQARRDELEGMPPH